MMWMNRNFRKFMIAGIVLVVFIFVLPYIWPVNAEWYFSNLNWMVPLVIIIFIAPIVPFILSNWDIYFFFQSQGNNLVAIMSNNGTSPYNFNRIQFASGKKYKIFGKREFYPQKGISGEDVEYHGADTLSQTLHQHIGCTLRKGMPITLTIRGHQALENLCNFQENKRVCLSLYYEGTNQRVYSQHIPPEIIIQICHNKG